MTNKISYLDDGDLCVLSKDKVEFYDENQKKDNKKILLFLMIKIFLTKVIIKILCLKKYLNNQLLLKIVLMNILIV